MFWNGKYSEVISDLECGIIPWRTPWSEDSTHFCTNSADEFIQAIPAQFHYGGLHAYYFRPIPEGTWPNHIYGDFIQIPHKHQYIELSEFYVNTFHEASHWAEIRVGWTGDGLTGELIAEITAANLANLYKIPNLNTENHEKYVTDWLKIMRNNSDWIASAAHQAQKITEYLLKFRKGLQND